jgi:hypothetical protein
VKFADESRVPHMGTRSVQKYDASCRTVQWCRDFCKRGVEGRKWNEKFSDLHRAFRDFSDVLAGRLSGFSHRLRNDPSAFGFRAGLSGASLHAP